MGSTNHGSQNLTYNFFEEASALNFNARNLNIQPRGIYKGGYLTKVSDSIVSLSILTAEIGDNDIQVSVNTIAAATLSNDTLDSGTISSGTPYLVLRWAYLASAANYMEVHALAEVTLDNDIIIGKCVFDGAELDSFDYTERTYVTTADTLLSVESSSGLCIQLRAGRIHTATGYVLVPETLIGPFSPPESPNSRIDLITIADDGSPTVVAGAAAPSPTAPAYKGRFVVAEITIVNGATTIPASRIRDVRIFGARPVNSTQYLATYNSTTQQIANGAFTKADLGTIKNQSGITITNNRITLTAGRKYALSYAVSGQPTADSTYDPLIEARWQEISGDLSWDLEVISVSKAECAEANRVSTNISNTCYIIPSSDTVIELQVYTQNDSQKSVISLVTTNIMNID